MSDSPIKELLKNVTLADLWGLSLSNQEDCLDIRFQIPMGGDDGDALEISDSIFFDMHTPQYLRDATRTFVEAALQCVREGDHKKTEHPCETCVATCCRNWEVRVTEEDIARLREVVPDIDDKLDAYLTKDGNPELAWTGYVAGLRMVETENPVTEETEKVCVFFDEDEMLCSVHEHRPKVCREFTAWACDRKTESPELRDLVDAGKRRLNVLG